MKILYLENLELLIDDEDFTRVSTIKWQIKGLGPSIGAKINGVNVSLAAFVMKDYRQLYDHKDRDFRNNQKNNLRECDNSQNGANRRKPKGGTSKYKGVSFCKQSRIKPWKCGIKVDGYSIHLGYYYTQEEAAMIYNKAAKKHFGEFAVLNVITTN
jgi:hypothetical protein